MDAASTVPPFESRYAGTGVIIPVFSLTAAEIFSDKGAMKIINECLEKKLKYFMVVENWKINEQNEEACNEICTLDDLLKTVFCDTVCTTQ